MGHSKQDLPSLVGSRICHDLISPIGAIGNGLELLQMQSIAAETPEMTLIAESLENATARIRFFRIAFGMASDTQEYGADEIRSVLSDLTRGGRFRYDWQGGETCARSELRAIFLALMCLETALPLGDTLVIQSQDGRWQLRGSGPRVRWESALWDGIGAENEIKADQVQFALLPGALEHLGRALRTEVGETSVTLSF